MVDIQQLRYRVTALLSDGNALELTDFVEELSWEENEGELSQRASISFKDAVGSKYFITRQLSLCTHIFILYQHSSKEAWLEAMRGIVWAFEQDRSDKKSIRITMYNNIKYMQETEEDIFLTENMGTAESCLKIMENTGIELVFAYGGATTHAKQVFRGRSPSEALLTTLNFAKKQTKKKYAVYGEDGKLIVQNAGHNEVYYCFTADNILSVNNKVSLDGMITRVVVRTQADDDTLSSVEVTLDGKTKYGILQAIVYRSEDTSLDDAKKTAQEKLDENGDAERSITIKTPDIPGIRKGHRIHCRAEMLNGLYLVKSISHDANSKTMTMEVELFE